MKISKTCDFSEIVREDVKYVPLVHGSLPELQSAYHVPFLVHVCCSEQLQRIDAFFPAEQLRNAYEVLDDMRVT